MCRVVRARFRGQPKVKPYSAVHPGFIDPIDKKSGKPGVHLSTGGIRWIDPDQAKVETSWSTSGKSGASGICLVQKQRRGWVVLYYAVQEIS